MVCFLISSVPNAAKSEFVLPIPKKPGLKRDRKTAVPISPTTGLAVLVSDADVQWFIHEVDGKYEVHSLTSKITKDMLDPGDVEALEIDDDLLVLSWCALGVPFVGLHLAMIWCALVLDVMYEDPSPAQRIHKDLLDPGGFVTTDGLVQEVQVMLAEVYLVMGSSKEDVIFHVSSTATWCDL